MSVPDPMDSVSTGGGGGGSGGANLSSGGGEALELSTCVPLLASSAGTALIVIGFLAIVGLVYARYNLSLSLLVGWALLAPVSLVYFLLTNCTSGTVQERGSGFDPGSAASESLFNPGTIPPWALGVVLGGAFLGAVALLYMTTGEDETVVLAEEEEEVDEAELDRLAQAAGRAADRIEKHDAEVDNAVYRAWLEMTGVLDVDTPETYSAGDFAEEAIDLGMDPSDVHELTRLFNEVRYGGKDAETREDRALAVLRNIEEYTETIADDADIDADAVDEEVPTAGEIRDETGDDERDEHDTDGEDDR